MLEEMPARQDAQIRRKLPGSPRRFYLAMSLLMLVLVT
jgi:hypothetical protein